MGYVAPKQNPGIPHISERLLAVLELIHQRHAAGSPSPTEEEIAQRVGCTPSNAHNLLVRLAQEGLVVLAGGKHRAVRINYPAAAPVLFLADASRVLSLAASPASVSRNARVAGGVSQEILAAYASWCDEMMCVTATDPCTSQCSKAQANGSSPRGALERADPHGSRIEARPERASPAAACRSSPRGDVAK